MKLYATTTSERASKGQGGNDFLEIELSIDNGNLIVGYIYLNINEDIENHGDKANEWIVQFTKSKDIDADIIAQGHYIPKIKGKSQKGEKCCGQHIENGLAYCLNCKKFED